MKLWIDSTIPSPEGYVWCKTTNEAKNIIACVQQMLNIEKIDNLPYVEEINIGDYTGEKTAFGGSFVKILKFIEKQGWNFPIRLHGRNEIENSEMLEIIHSNNWVLKN